MQVWSVLYSCIIASLHVEPTAKEHQTLEAEEPEVEYQEQEPEPCGNSDQDQEYDYTDFDNQKASTGAS